jgi:hypothetical protein
MKKLIIALACAALALSSYAQGTVNFNTQKLGILVYDTDGTTPLAGTGFWAQLYTADGAGAAEATLTAKGNPVNFRGGLNAGYVVTSAPANASVIATLGTPTSVTVQMRAWAGNFASYDLATGPTGKSVLFSVTPSYGAVAPADLVGLQSFKLIPEPTTIALGVMGVGALLFRRRK